jgi:hypothetical protein
MVARVLRRPQHASRMRPPLYAALCAAGSRVAQHGPHRTGTRLAYRRWKKRRARQRMIEEYGDPTAPESEGLRDRTLGLPTEGVSKVWERRTF